MLFARVHVVALVVDVVSLKLVFSALVVVHAEVIAFPKPVSVVGCLLFTFGAACQVGIQSVANKWH